ncbi:flotillin family protein [Saccharospirillum mangrovi]|uniref:flotillin family protein n=1 Tax=Saccharospirillum mangrovi TaxID=2161747 RepID=UPI000D3C6B8B|nr:flotillin domain-containing protein [Saccharospirillum mangrovi]
MANSLIWVLVTLVVLAIVIAILARFYQRGTTEVALVRTGFGGRKVALDAGLLAIPYFNNVTRVNMQTLRLEVKRAGNASLITKDRLRVDVGVEFYVAVRSERSAVGRAAQTLGNRTFDAARLRDLIEGKLVDALRAVAARYSLDDLHEKRGDFVRDVKSALESTLEGNGLALESVSLTDMDQTPFTDLDENNAFNAAGMRKLSELIARSKKERADIDADAEMAVRQSALTLAKRKLDLQLEEERARIEQTQQIELLKASQLAEVAARKADSERAIAASRIEMERAITEATLKRDIDLHAQREAERQARIRLDGVEAQAVAAHEKVATDKAVYEAERAQRVAALKADEAAAARIASAKALQAELEAEAEGRRALVQAENGMSDSLMAMKTEQARLDALPKAIGEMVKPAEKIESIRIHQITGLGQPLGSDGNRVGERSASNAALDAILGLAVQLPALRKLGEELGLSMDSSLQSLSGDKKG